MVTAKRRIKIKFFIAEKYHKGIYNVNDFCYDSVMALSEQDIRQIIKDHCDRDGRENVAKELKVSPSYISMLLSKNDPRPVTAQIAERLGFTLETSVHKVFLPQ